MLQKDSQQLSEAETGKLLDSFTIVDRRSRLMQIVMFIPALTFVGTVTLLLLREIYRFVADYQPTWVDFFLQLSLPLGLISVIIGLHAFTSRSWFLISRMRELHLYEHGARWHRRYVRWRDVDGIRAIIASNYILCEVYDTTGTAVINFAARGLGTLDTIKFTICKQAVGRLTALGGAHLVEAYIDGIRKTQSNEVIVLGGLSMQRKTVWNNTSTVALDDVRHVVSIANPVTHSELSREPVFSNCPHLLLLGANDEVLLSMPQTGVVHEWMVPIILRQLIADLELNP